MAENVVAEQTSTLIYNPFPAKEQPRDDGLRRLALEQACHSQCGKAPEIITAAAAQFYDFLRSGQGKIPQ